ncbi:phosphopentomutase [Mesomycoplasma neurolyticum]|uniref:Phosphopentomutase n=1 Tax=Mesomycoplasma neurolyticum TaxID=2120 RepID=A0A449A5C3_9BACT|nr:phosphopentomutase [Mesomycoplasma neurolyticum]VEU59429.1 Phosphopentomutase [Mesomycoplasma neurolyticum]
MKKFRFKRIFMIVTDSLGIGDDGRQHEFNDQGADTLWHVSEKSDILNIPTWKKLGIGEITKVFKHNNRNKNHLAYMARIIEKSNAKDTLAGHWEMMGIETKIPSPNFVENGFPAELIEKLEKAFDNRKIIGNRAESGTVILAELGQREIDNNEIIVYTSPDSTLQICGHEKYMTLDNLYRYAKEARRICSENPAWNVARIIARPYVGENGNFTRTFNRHDYANKPPKATILNKLQEKGIKTIAIGKINDIFVNQGIDVVFPPASDDENMDVAINIANQKTENEFIFVNLVEFDSHYGHRRNLLGYAENINRFDVKLTKLINAMDEDDLLIMTSDHGNDPSFPGSDHTREALPLTVFSKSFKGKNKNLGTLSGLGTTGNIIARNFGLELIDTGEDIFDKLI